MTRFQIYIVGGLLSTSFAAPVASQHERNIFPGRSYPATRSRAEDSGVVIADVDQDGNLDLATKGVTGSGQAGYILWGQADGEPTEGVVFLPRSVGGGGPAALAAGDFGSPESGGPDGITDFAWVSKPQYQPYNLGVSYGVGDRSFINETLITGDPFHFARVLVSGDFNGDGLDDLAFLSNWRPPKLGVIYGSQTGLGVPQYLPLPIKPNAMARPARDLDGDGTDDIVIAGSDNAGNVAVTIAYGGVPPDEPVATAEYYPNVWDVAVDDFDGDSFFDIAVGIPSDAVLVFYGNQHAEFHDPAEIILVAERLQRTMAAGDLDGDGRADVVLGGSLGPPFAEVGPAVLYGRSSRSFSDPVGYPPCGHAADAVAISDLDEDGRNEIVVIAGQRAVVHRSKPRGPVLTDTVVPLPGVNPVDMVSADFNGDRRLDLAIADQLQNRVVFVPGTGRSAFEAVTGELAVDGTPRRMAVGHFDDDLLPDIAVITDSSSTLTIWHGAEGGFPSTQQLVPIEGTVTAMVAADFDGDALSDIAVLHPASVGAEIIVFWGGFGDNAQPFRHEIPYPAFELTAGLFDSDDLADLAVTYQEPTYRRATFILYGRTDQTLTEGQHYIYTQTGRITSGDINADGLLDLVTSSTSTYGRVYLHTLLGLPGGGFDPQPPQATQGIETIEPGCQSGIGIADFDRDGVGDVTFGTSYAHPVLFGQQDAGLDPNGWSFATRAPCGPIAVGDFNLDGRPDIVQASNYGADGADSFLTITLNQSNAKIRGDLAVVTVSAPPTGTAGETITVSWTVENALDTPISGRWIDAFYLSRDEQWDINDIRLGTREFLGMLAAHTDANDSDSYQVEVKDVLLPGVDPSSSWYVLVRTDATDAVLELTGEQDNVLATPIAIDFPAFDVCPPDTYPPACGVADAFHVARAAVYYRINSEAGKDMLVKLDSLDDVGVNELYIRHGDIPSRSSFDDQYDTPFAPDQSVRIPGTEEGPYYILAYGAVVPPGGATNLTLHAEYLPFEVTSYHPPRGGNTGRVTVTFTGSGFKDGITATLYCPDDSVVVPDHVFYYDSGSFAEIFNLDGLQADMACAIEVRNPDGTVIDQIEGLWIEQGLEFDISGTISGPRRIRPPAKAKYRVNIDNNGNVDIPYLFVDISFPSEHIESIVIDRPDLIDPPPIDGIEWGGIDPTVEIDGRVHYPLLFLNYPVTPTEAVIGFQASSPNQGNVAALSGAFVRPGDLEFTITPKADATRGTSYDVKVIVAPMDGIIWSQSQTLLADLSRSIILADPASPSDVVGAAMDPSVWRQAWLNSLAEFENSRSTKHSGGRLFSTAPSTIYGYSEEQLIGMAFKNVMFSALVKAARPRAPHPWIVAEVVLEIAVEVGLEIWAQNIDAMTDLNERRLLEEEEYRRLLHKVYDLKRQYDELMELAGLEIITAITWPIDPNDKLSPEGYGEAGFVSANRPIQYRIRFENLPAAGAAALEVKIVDNLSSYLDWTTAVLHEISFGGHVIKVPEGMSHFSGTVDIDGWTWDETNGWRQYDDGIALVPLVAEVEAGLELYENDEGEEAARLVWTIIGANRATGYFAEDPYASFPEDPNAGLLPPNLEELFYTDPDDPSNEVHPGEGYVTFSVSPKPGLPTGTEIYNQATIYFDFDFGLPPLDTPEIFNTIDAGSPSSQADPLPAETFFADFDVCWSGEDDLGGSGIDTYTLYVSDNDGPYTSYVTTEENCVVFEDALCGHTYRFFPRARDHVGNLESPPTDETESIVPDAWTTIPGYLGDVDGGCDLDLVDYRYLHACLGCSGPGQAPNFQECVDSFDFDGDLDVDLHDLAEFQSAFTGSLRKAGKPPRGLMIREPARSSADRDRMPHRGRPQP